MRAGLEVFGDGAAFGGGPGGIVGDHAGGFPIAGEHRFGCGGAPGGEFTGEPDAATVRGEAALDPGGARQRATPICSPCLPTAPTKCVSEVATARLTASTAWNLRGRPASGSLAPASHPDAFLALQVDGPVVLDAAAGARLWHTGPRHLRGDRSMSAGVNIASRLSQPRALNAPAPRPDTVSGRSRHHRRMGHRRGHAPHARRSRGISRRRRVQRWPRRRSGRPCGRSSSCRRAWFRWWRRPGR